MIFNTLRRTAHILAPALALALPALAHAEEAQTFIRDGVTYSYSKTVEHGATVLTGTADNRAFRLVIKGDQVTGKFGLQSVRFNTSEAKSRSLAMR